jgi:mannan endo-1,4-beta-mannosidase
MRSVLRIAVVLITISAAWLFGTVPKAGAAPVAQGQFVAAKDGHLLLNGKPFRFGGVNMYWLGLDENVDGIDYPTFFRIRDGLMSAKLMNAGVVRAHTLGISVGDPKSLEPALDQFNPQAFATIDYAIAEAGRLGIKLSIPLIDEWNYYHGGRDQFVKWRGLTDRNAFYTDPVVISDFQEYVSHLLEHRNPYTGLRYVDDPTIMSWELGNELNNMPASWITTMSNFLHHEAPKQLITAGQQGGINPATLTAAGVNIVQVHYYPPTAAQVSADASTVTQAGKVFVAGEYGSNSATDDLLQQVAADQNVSGALAWSLFPRHDDHGYVQHDDGFTLHIPGDDAAMRAHVDAITKFDAAMGGQAGRPALQQPLITSVDKRGGLNRIAWRGDAGADAYRVERRANGGQWQTVGTGLTDNDTPWLDLSTPAADVSYRVAALDRQGAVVATSEPMQVGADSNLLVDPLESWRHVHDHNGLVVTPTDDGVTVAPAPGGQGSASWAVPDLTSLTATISSVSPQPRLLVEVPNGTGWRWVKTTLTAAGSHRYRLIAADLGGADTVRLRWPHGSTANVSEVAIASATDSPGNDIPAAFTLTSPTPGSTDAPLGGGLEWTAAADASFYSVLISQHADLSDPIVNVDQQFATSYDYAPGFDPETTYYVKITAHNRAGVRDLTGSPVSFTTRAVPAEGYVVDNFEGYASDADLQTAYQRNTGGDPITPTLTAGADGGQAMALDYQLQSSYYAGVMHSYADPQDWRGTGGIRLWVDPDGTDNTLSLQFRASGTYWEAPVPLSGNGPQVVTLPYSSFANPPWAEPGPLNLRSVTDFAIYIGGGTTGPQRLVVDDISAYKAP